DERAGRRVAAKVGALGRIDEISAGAVGLRAVRGVAERNEEAACIAGNPEDRHRARATREGDGDTPDARERRVVGAAVRKLERECAGRGRWRGFQAELEAEARVVVEVVGPEAGSSSSRDRRLRVLAKEELADG